MASQAQNQHFQAHLPLFTHPQAPFGIKSRLSEPRSLSEGCCGINFGVPEPKHPFCTPFQGHFGIKSRHFEPTRPSRWPLRLRISISKPICPFAPHPQAPFGIKSRLSEPALPSRWPHLSTKMGLLVDKNRFSCPQTIPVPLARVAGPEQERYACPSTRSGCAVPCGASRSQARVPSLPGPANPALSAPGKLELWRVVS